MYGSADLSLQEEGPISSILQIYHKAGNVCERKLETAHTLVFEKTNVFRVILAIADYAVKDFQFHNEELIADLRRFNALHLKHHKSKPVDVG